jgi:hypothetical protein
MYSLFRNLKLVLLRVPTTKKYPLWILFFIDFISPSFKNIFEPRISRDYDQYLVPKGNLLI